MGWGIKVPKIKLKKPKITVGKKPLKSVAKLAGKSISDYTKISATLVTAGNPDILDKGSGGLFSRYTNSLESADIKGLLGSGVQAAQLYASGGSGIAANLIKSGAPQPPRAASYSPSELYETRSSTGGNSGSQNNTLIIGGGIAAIALVLVAALMGRK